eukprot:TRINITY_DN875_c0_g1::TRINITY_DN875_c0_g1_i1::g.25388::m.25388 TRINITY_DN875_c0_g1::TRINITY_DN875_c0_g1_i1::g.25388  ORF type:complete len:233 (-),score=31.29 TRINITY_DN875_c0_g1_i1:85-705(-)
MQIQWHMFCLVLCIASAWALAPVYQPESLELPPVHAPLVTCESNRSREFATALRTELLPTNWELKYWTFCPEDFAKIVETRDVLTTFISNKTFEICFQLGNRKDACQRGSEYVKDQSCPQVENFNFAGLIFGTWFYRFDMDNWFSFDTMWGKCSSYLAHFEQEFYLFKGFYHAKRLNTYDYGPTDLPVVIDHAEKSITLWTAALHD